MGRRFRASVLALTLLFVASGSAVALSGVPAPGSTLSVALPPAATAPPAAEVTPSLIPPTPPPESAVAVPVGEGPDAVLVDTANQTAFVSNEYSNNVSEISLANNQILAAIPVGSEPYPQGLALDLPNATVYVVTSGSDNVSAISIPQQAVVASITVGASPDAIAFNSANKDIYVANAGSGTVSVIATTTNHVIATIPVGPNPDAIAVDTTNHEVFVADAGSNNVSVISGTTNLVVNTTSVGASPGPYDAIAFYSPTNEIYVANIGSGNVSVIGGTNHTVVASIAVGSGPDGIVVDPVHSEIFVSNRFSSNVSVINGHNLTVVASIPVGSEPSNYGGIAFNSVIGDVYVPNSGSNNLSVISAATRTLVASVPTLGIPDAVGADTVNGTVYVADQGAANVTVFGLTPLTFQAVGLPPSSSWSVTAGSPPLVEHNTTFHLTGRIQIQEPNGVLSYAITAPAGYAVASVTGPHAPSQTSVTLPGVAVTLRVTFGPIETLTFVESGLPASTPWSLAISSSLVSGGPPSQSGSSTSTSISFSVVKDSWKFAVTSKPTVYTAVPSRGVVVVPAHAVTKALVFKLVTAVVLFRETGLRLGTRWQVNVTGPMDASLNSTTSVLRFVLENGTYSFVVGNFSALHPHPASGTFVVVAPHAATVIPVGFTAVALPRSGAPELALARE